MHRYFENFKTSVIFLRISIYCLSFKILYIATSKMVASYATPLQLSGSEGYSRQHNEKKLLELLEMHTIEIGQRLIEKCEIKLFYRMQLLYINQSNIPE